MEERLARLESHVEHIQSDLTDLKVDVRRLDAKTDSIKDSVAAHALQTERSFSRLTRWVISLATALLGVMAHGFKWL